MDYIHLSRGMNKQCAAVNTETNLNISRSSGKISGPANGLLNSFFKMGSAPFDCATV